MLKTNLSLRKIAKFVNPNSSSLHGDELFSGVCVDSRKIQQGEIFFALPGNCSDGHRYLEEAASKGAKAAVISGNYSGSLPDIPVIRAPDVLEALQLLARQILAEFAPKVIAVTGSLGKTTTKGFIHTLLEKKFRVASNPGNQNSQIGLPLSILNQLKGDEEVCVLEMGMTGFQQISKLVEIAPPYLALITSIFPVHIESFDSIEEISFAKSEIFGHPATEIAILNAEMAALDTVLESGNCKKYTFSAINPKADFFIEKDELRKRLLFFQEGKGAPMPEICLPGKHNLNNALAAMAAARKMGLSDEEIAERIPFLTLPERRFEIIEKKGVIFVNDSYNAAEASVVSAIDSLDSLNKEARKVAVLGDMLELGSLSESTHQRVAEHALNKLDLLFCYGNETKAMVDVWKRGNKPIYWFQEKNLLMDALKNTLEEGDLVLIKGSRAMQMWQVLEQY